MKYPQLVSPRAVNAISDWLVSRLEQLGVESPQIYTRLLLSLLQSSVQVNDPIEFSNLEAFFANRKGGHKRFHLPSDTETLKKLNAVQCLREIVSNEQETATIEQLVDELCEKIKDIEKQTQNLSDKERFLIETQLNTDTLLQNQTNTQLQHPSSSSNNHSRHNQHHNHHQHHNQSQHQPHQQIPFNCYNSQSLHLNNDSKRHHHHVVVATTSSLSTTNSDPAISDLDNDPKKRYFRAFPALSKEMEDSFLIWRRNAKSLTWPVVGRSYVVDPLTSKSLSSSSASSIISSSNFGENSVLTTKSAEKKLKTEVDGYQMENKFSAKRGGGLGSAFDIPLSGKIDVQQQGAVVTAASAKKKSKRRRNQALCKGKPIQNIRKLSVGNTSNSIGDNKYHRYTHYRNSSPAWDTDFKGCWEMGPDLIKDFISRQNGNKPKKSNGERMDHEEHNERKILNELPIKDEDEPIMNCYIDLSFCCDDDEYENEINDETQHHTEEGVDYVDEDYDDNTLASVPELATDSINPKRLYQREGQSQKSLASNASIPIVDGDNTFDELTGSVDPLDFEQYKAKFNKNVAALWKDGETTPTQSTQQQETLSAQIADNSLSGGISSAFYATTSLKAYSPFKNELWNFWSNYDQQQHDQMLNKLSTTDSTSSMITTTRLDDSSASSGADVDIGISSDYFSMPSNLDDFDKSVGGVRRTNKTGASLGAHTPLINIFLQNSIWSTSGDCVDAIGRTSASDTHENFLYKVWHSNKKLSQLDVGNVVYCDEMPPLVANNHDDGSDNDSHKSKECSSSLMVNNPNLGASLQFFPPYQNVKWSEGINGGPTYTQPHQHEMDSLNNASALRPDNSYAGYNATVNISGATWEAPAYGQNAQPDLKSWCASNPMSLTEMYGNDVCDSIVNQAPEENKELNAMGPAVTLPNHCDSTSGFVAYSLVKKYGLVQPSTKPLQTSNAVRLPKSNDGENLYNSERTNFRPIDFEDGHTFDISNDLDTVEFERTASGLMRYDSEEYLEYTRNDIYMADEEVDTNSTNLLKHRGTANEDKNDKFVIRFRVKRSEEVACQTEDQDFQLAVAKRAEGFPAPPLQVTTMFSNTFSLSRQANNEAIMAAVTKAVAAAAKAAAENHLHPNHFTAANSCNNVENNPLWMNDNSICDEVDFCKTDSGKMMEQQQQQQQQLTQNWAMQEIQRQYHQKCYLPQEQQQQHEIKRKYPSTMDIDRSEENSLDNTSLHTLWGMCAVCNNCEYDKSMPANRLLRDELQLEADEIMSDLRFMQDLYIGNSESNETGPHNTTAGENENKLYAKNNKDMGIDLNSMSYPWNRDIKKTDVGPQQGPEQVTMLKKVNQLIEDLLKPENSVKLPKESEEYNTSFKEEIEFKNTWNLQQLATAADQDKANKFWHFKEEEDNNIWQHKPLKENIESKFKENEEKFMQPMKLLKQVGGSLSEDSQYMETLNWEHDNLAKIWQQTIPTSTEIEETLIKNKQNEMANNNIKENLAKEMKEGKADEEKETFLEGGQKQLIEEKNLRNLFLNNSATKLKLITNRKRRHSASQNLYQQQHLEYNSSSSNNNNNNISKNKTNNDSITDLNAYKQKLNDTIKAAKEQQHQQEILNFNNSSPTSNMNLEEEPTKQTIITCKYWTTATNGTQSSLDSAAAAMMLLAAATNVNHANEILNADRYDHEDVMPDENTFDNNFSCLFDKNASILKHMTMMTRPLTR